MPGLSNSPHWFILPNLDIFTKTPSPAALKFNPKANCAGKNGVD